MIEIYNFFKAHITGAGYHKEETQATKTKGTDLEQQEVQNVVVVQEKEPPTQGSEPIEKRVNNRVRRRSNGK